jgi:type II secretory pathway component PulF
MVITVLLLLLAFLPWLAPGLELLLVVPSYERTFAEFKVKLPLATEWVINASRWFARYWYVAVLIALALAPLVSTVFVLVRHQLRSRWLSVVCWLLVLLPPIVLAVLVAVALYLP